LSCSGFAHRALRSMSVGSCRFNNNEKTLQKQRNRQVGNLAVVVSRGKESLE
jgi:hypothetical protein